MTDWHADLLRLPQECRNTWPILGKVALMEGLWILLTPKGSKVEELRSSLYKSGEHLEHMPLSEGLVLAFQTQLEGHDCALMFPQKPVVLYYCLRKEIRLRKVLQSVPEQLDSVS